MRFPRRLRAIAAGALFVIASGCVRAPASHDVPAATVRFALAADPQSLDPLFAHVDANGVEQQVARLAFEPFIDVDERGRPVPVLLDRIPTVRERRRRRATDARSCTICGATRAGKTVRRSPRTTSSGRCGRSWTIGIRSPRAPATTASPRRVRSTRTPFASRCAKRGRRRSRRCSATAPPRSTCCPAHLLEREASIATSAFAAHPIGDGPYRFVSWSRGDRLVYEANPRYRGGAPAVKRLEIRIVPDPGTNFTLLRSGAIDWNLVSPAQRESLRGDRGLAFRTVPLALIAGIAINTTHPPLDDVRVRRALAASIDRATISKKLTFGRYPVVDTAQPIGSWARDPSVHEPAYDPAAADRLLDAAGWRRGADGVRKKDGRTLALTYVQFPESQTGVRVATLVQSELASRGVRVSIKSLSNVQLFLPRAQGGTLASGAFDLAYVPWPMGADPDDSQLLACNGSANFMRWCDPQVDALERRAVRVPGRAERRALYGRIERRVAEQVPIVYLFDPSYSYAYRRELHGFFPNAFTPTWNASRWRVVPGER